MRNDVSIIGGYLHLKNYYFNNNLWFIDLFNFCYLYLLSYITTIELNLKKIIVNNLFYDFI